MSVTIEPELAKTSAAEVMAALKTTEPRCWVGVPRAASTTPESEADKTIFLHPFGMRPKELPIPAERIKTIVLEAQAAAAAASAR